MRDDNHKGHARRPTTALLISTTSERQEDASSLALPRRRLGHTASSVKPRCGLQPNERDHRGHHTTVTSHRAQ